MTRNKYGSIFGISFMNIFVSGFISIRYCYLQVHGKYPTSTNGLHDDIPNTTRWPRNACWHSKANTGKC